VTLFESKEKRNREYKLNLNEETILCLLDKRSITPYGISADIDTFLKGEKSYLGHMVKKEKFIKSNLGRVLEHFSIDCSDGWKLKKAFVVNHNYQVAYYYKKAIDFVELSDLAAYLDS